MSPVRELLRYAAAIDAIYKESECGRKAVIKHLGTIHSPLVLHYRTLKPSPLRKTKGRRT